MGDVEAISESRPSIASVYEKYRQAFEINEDWKFKDIEEAFFVIFNRTMKESAEREVIARKSRSNHTLNLFDLTHKTAENQRKWKAILFEGIGAIAPAMVNVASSVLLNVPTETAALAAHTATVKAIGEAVGGCFSSIGRFKEGFKKSDETILGYQSQHTSGEISRSSELAQAQKNEVEKARSGFERLVANMDRQAGMFSGH